MYYETRQRTSIYTEKCSHILQTEQFTKLRHDPTKSIENKIQRELTRLTIQEYHQLYPTGSNSCTFYGTAKLRLLPTNDIIEELPIRPIVSNINARNNRLGKCLA